MFLSSERMTFTKKKMHLFMPPAEPPSLPFGNQTIHLWERELYHLFRGRMSLSIQVSSVMMNVIQRATVFRKITAFSSYIYCGMWLLSVAFRDLSDSIRLSNLTEHEGGQYKCNTITSLNVFSWNWMFPIFLTLLSFIYFLWQNTSLRPHSWKICKW